MQVCAGVCGKCVPALLKCMNEGREAADTLAQEAKKCANSPLGHMGGRNTV